MFKKHGISVLLMEIGTWPWLILLLNLFRKLFGCLSKMRNHSISTEANSRVIVTQRVKMLKEAHLHQEILTSIKPPVQVDSRSNQQQKCSNIAVLESAPFQCILFPFLRPRGRRWRRKPRLLLGGMRWDKVHPNVLCPLFFLLFHPFPTPFPFHSCSFMLFPTF